MLQRSAVSGFQFLNIFVPVKRTIAFITNSRYPRFMDQPSFCGNRPAVRMFVAICKLNTQDTSSEDGLRPGFVISTSQLLAVWVGESSCYWSDYLPFLHGNQKERRNGDVGRKTMLPASGRKPVLHSRPLILVELGGVSMSGNSEAEWTEGLGGARHSPMAQAGLI